MIKIMNMMYNDYDDGGESGGGDAPLAGAGK